MNSTSTYNLTFLNFSQTLYVLMKFVRKIQKKSAKIQKLRKISRITRNLQNLTKLQNLNMKFLQLKKKLKTSSRSLKLCHRKSTVAQKKSSLNPSISLANFQLRPQSTFSLFCCLIRREIARQHSFNMQTHPKASRPLLAALTCAAPSHSL